jgi:CheY-like chemotaxis protein
LKLLVVSPEADLARYIAMTLPDPVWEVVHAESAREGLRTLIHAAPDMLYVDAGVHDLPALLRAVRRTPRGDDTRIVLLGGDEAPPEVDHHLPARPPVLDLLDLARSEELRRASGAPRPPRSVPAVVRSPAPPTRAFVDRDAPTVPPPSGWTPAEGAPPSSLTAPRSKPYLISSLTSPAAPSQGGAPPAPPRFLPPTAEGPDAATELLRKRLAQELRAVETADHYAVLAIRRGAPPEVSLRAAERMRARYGALGAHPDAGIRRLAAAMCERVETAVRALEVDLPTHRLPEAMESLSEPVSRPGAGPLEAGLELLRAGRWEEAERWLSAARDRHPGDPLLLASLGYAHARNPSAAPDSRHRKGLELLNLALRLQPELADAHAWSAELHAIRGDRARARACAEAALVVDPAHALARSRLAES